MVSTHDLNNLVHLPIFPPHILYIPDSRRLKTLQVHRTFFPIVSHTSSTSTPDTKMTKFKIAIIGAGPAGATLARLLHLSNIPVTVFEGETSINVRSQGGTLDLRTEGGLRALKKSSLLEEFCKYARFDGEALIVADKNFQKYVNISGGKQKQNKSTGRPEIDREQLRQLLVDSLPEGMVRWGCRLTSIDTDLTMHFSHGIETGYDLVIGADGAWSKVRPLLTEEKPYYSGISGLQQNISNPESQYPEGYEIINRGSIFCYSDGKSLNAQQLGNGSLSIATYKVDTENWMSEEGVDMNDANAVREQLAKTYEDWVPELRNFTQKADDHSTWRTLYMLPVGIKWDHRKGVTLLGDAAHLMTPFAGMGVNLAMEDAMYLAEAIIAADKESTLSALDRKVQEFEEDMFRRATEVQQITYGTVQDMFLNPGAPMAVIDEWMIRIGGYRMNPILKVAFSAAIRVYFWFFRRFSKA